MANGNSAGALRANLAGFAAVAALAAQYIEKNYHVQITADQILDLGAFGLYIVHLALLGLAPLKPYANRIFDHYFPPKPGDDNVKHS